MCARSCDEDLAALSRHRARDVDETHVCSDDPECTLSVDEHWFVSMSTRTARSDDRSASGAASRRCAHRVNFEFAGNRATQRIRHVRANLLSRPSSPSPTRSSIDSPRAIHSSRPRPASPATTTAARLLRRQATSRSGADRAQPADLETLDAHSDVDRIAAAVIRERLSASLALDGERRVSDGRSRSSSHRSRRFARCSNSCR